MKRIKLFIHEPSINKVIGRELNLFLKNETSILDVISELDKIINSNGTFPIPDYRSRALGMLGIQAYGVLLVACSGCFLASAIRSVRAAKALLTSSIPNTIIVSLEQLMVSSKLMCLLETVL